MKRPDITPTSRVAKIGAHFSRLYAIPSSCFNLASRLIASQLYTVPMKIRFAFASFSFFSAMALAAGAALMVFIFICQVAPYPAA